MRKTIPFLLVILLSAASLFLPASLAQETERPAPRTRVGTPSQEGLNRVFRNYERMHLDTTQAARQVEQTGRLTISTERQTLELELEPHDLRAENYRAEETVAPGVTLPVVSGPVRTFKGKVVGNDDAQARFTIDEESFEGSILTPEERYYVEPARRYVPSASPTEFLFYKASDVIETESVTCAVSLHDRVSDAAEQLGDGQSNSATAQSSVTVTPKALARPLEVDLATEADFEYVTALGGATNANNEILSIMNQVEGAYQRDIGLSFKITFQHAWATAADPYTTLDPVLALKEFGNYWNANFTNVTRDVAHMWTGKNLNSVAGVGWTGVVCKSPASAYSLSERFTIAPHKYVLPAHELGHNFGASHSDATAACANTIMQATTTDRSVLSFCQVSRDAITNFINANSACLSAAPACTYTIAPTSEAFPSSGGTGSIAVTADGGCAWTARSSDTWITITAGASGTGNGTVSYSVAANTAATARTGTIAVAGKTFTVTQAAATVCTFTITPTSASFASGGGTGDVTVTTQAGCAWTAASNDTWITITAGARGSGNGTVSYTVAANTVTTARTGTLTIAGKTFIVTQAALACTFSISPTSASLPSGGGTGSVAVTATAGCAWTARSNVTWITVTAGASGTGNGTVNYSVTANTAATSRSGTITIAGKTFTVTQAGAVTCTFTITPTSASFASGGGTGAVTVTTQAGCAWTAKSNVAWITVTAGASGTGNGTVSYSVAANNVTTARTGTLTVAGKTFTVTQAALVCTFTLSPTSVSFPSSGGTGTLTVTIQASCAWTAVSNATWITITAGASGSGNGTVHYSVAANTAPTSRTGTITVAGKTFTVTQAAAAPTLTSVTLSPTLVTGCKTVTGTVRISAPAPAGGMVVTLSDTLASTVVPSSVTIAAGTITKTFVITTSPVAADQTGTVTAKLGAVTKSAALTIRRIGVLTLAVSPNPIIGGNAATGTVTLECPAGPASITVTLSDNLAATTVPASFIIPAGTLRQSFQITTTAVAATQTGTLTATANAIAKSTSVTVRPIGVLTLTLSPNPVAGGSDVTGTVTLERPAGPGSIVVTLSSNNPGVANPTVTSITIPAGVSKGTFTVSTTQVQANTSVIITATANGVSKTATLTVTPSQGE